MQVSTISTDFPPCTAGYHPGKILPDSKVLLCLDSAGHTPSGAAGYAQVAGYKNLANFYLIAAGAAVLFLPGWWKLAAGPLLVLSIGTSISASGGL